jgi:hypothetical protein
MQVNSLIKYLDQSDLISSVSEKEILPIIKEFPYCQTGHLMYAIQLNSNSSILFEEQLKKAASYCPDRVKLFKHIHQVTKEEKSLEKESNGKEKIKKETAVVDEKFVPSKDEDGLGLLEKEYLSQAISSSIILESDEQNLNVENQDEKLVEKEVNLFDVNEEHTFSDWLKHISGEEIVGEKEDSLLSSNAINRGIVDKFIQEDPRIEPKKTKFYSPTNMARLSVTDSGFVSETLALIHVDQGNFQEAITTYEKLSLKNPKKRSYFAAQINILKKKLK